MSQCFDPIFAKTSRILNKKRTFFVKIFGENIFESITSVPVGTSGINPFILSVVAFGIFLHKFIHLFAGKPSWSFHVKRLCGDFFTRVNVTKKIDFRQKNHFSTICKFRLTSAAAAASRSHDSVTNNSFR
jgi:hypothetical protein